ncbi:plastocyanin/azurin family copper-binding protein [Haladaptatus sp. DYSN1]|uniref:cupredoxin domain-containing protein n=1 Tax=unclassified Haladaptatus TaxID=2622732 RepID=UPI002404E039|nr:plastocyanin/azurin family copper-binding protein [Haladaptatus sp. DYSN1]
MVHIDDDQTGEMKTAWPRRRSVLRAVGAGAAIPFLTGVGASSTADPATWTYGRLQEDDEGENGENGDGETVTAHVVHLLETFPPTNPNRPLDFFFQPTGLHVEPGDVLKFVFDTPRHTVTSYSNAFGQARRHPEGIRGFSSPVLGWVPGTAPVPGEGGDGGQGGNGDDSGQNDTDDQTGPVPEVWLLTLEEAGVYDVYCAPHEVFGMVMRVVVGDVADEDVDFEFEDAENLPEEGVGPVGLARAILTDPQLTPAAIQEAGSVRWEDLNANQSNGGDENGNGTDGNGNGGEGSDEDPDAGGQ